ncbi:hypothetical protein ACFE04_017727 [Oxalis oulophora]
MEEEKAVAYYNELTRKGEGAARFKQGLGFGLSSGSSKDTVPTRGSALSSSSSSSSFLSSFVKASSPSNSSQLDKEAQLSSIQNKLKKKSTESQQRSKDDRDRDSRVSERDIRRREDRSRSRSRSRERYRDRDRDRYSNRSRDRDVDRRDSRRKRRRSRERSESPRRDGRRSRERDLAVKDRVEGYDKMTPAERVKAKMKLQLAQTSQKDSTIGTGSGWERFEFDKDAPLDDDAEEIEGAEGDAAVIKHVGQNFRFAAIEQKREEQIRAAHDEAMFGVSSNQSSLTPEVENDKIENPESTSDTSLLSEKVLAKQQGSWRDRARKT